MNNTVCSKVRMHIWEKQVLPQESNVSPTSHHFYRTHSPYLASKYRHKGDKGPRWQVTSNIGDKGIKREVASHICQTTLLIPCVVQDSKGDRSRQRYQVTRQGFCHRGDKGGQSYQTALLPYSMSLDPWTWSAFVSTQVHKQKWSGFLYTALYTSVEATAQYCSHI